MHINRATRVFKLVHLTLVARFYVIFSPLYRYQRCQLNVLELVSTAKALIRNFDYEVHVCLLWVEILHQLICSHRCTSRCQQVIMNQHHVIRSY